MKPTSIFLTLIVAACGLCAVSVSAGNETVTCPAAFPTNIIQFGSADEGWKAEFGERPPSLVGWGLDSGPPSELAALIPSGEGKGQISWSLEGPFPEGVWVDCVYADGALKLTKRLAATSGICTAPSKNVKTGKRQPVSFVCR